MLHGSQLQHGPSATKAPNDPQQRAPVPRQSSTPSAGPSCPRANQARTPRAGLGSIGDSDQAAESATSVPDRLRPRRRMAGSGTEAVALLIRGTGRATQPPARAPGACHPAAGRLAQGLYRQRSATHSNGGGVDTRHRPPARAAARPPRPGDPVREAAPSPDGCPRPTSPPSGQWPGGLRPIGMAYLHANTGLLGNRAKYLRHQHRAP
jgi:hypothetical protein